MVFLCIEGLHAYVGHSGVEWYGSLLNLMQLFPLLYLGKIFPRMIRRLLLVLWRLSLDPLGLNAITACGLLLVLEFSHWSPVSLLLLDPEGRPLAMESCLFQGKSNMSLAC